MTETIAAPERNKRPRARARIYDLILLGAFFALGPAVVGTIAAGLFQYYAGAIAGSGADDFGALFLRFGGAWLAVVLYVWMVERRALGELGLIYISNLWAWIALAGLLAGGMIGWGAAWLLAGRAIQAGAEELLYRGWILQRVSERLGVRAGVMASTIIFSLAHIVNPSFHPLQLIPLAVFSLGMCWLVRRQGHLWGAIVIHTGWNWLADLIL